MSEKVVEKVILKHKN